MKLCNDKKVLKSILIKLRVKFKKHRGKVKLDIYMSLIKI